MAIVRFFAKPNLYFSNVFSLFGNKLSSLYSYSSVRNELFTKYKQLHVNSTLFRSKFDNNEEEIDFEDDEYSELTRNAYRIPVSGHNIFLIQPKIKWGRKANKLTTTEFQLAEAVTLAETLTDWKVVGKCITNLKNPDSKYLFGSGTIEDLKSVVRREKTITALFLGFNTLTGLQQATLEREFGVPVYDRFTVVLKIFAEHARTYEAKLQVALAEIPLLKSRLRMVRENSVYQNGNEMKNIGGMGETWLETRRMLLWEREAKLRNVLKKLQSRRSLLRQNRIKQDIPTIAVVGYTNCGKTSLIKCLTGDDRMQPKNQLFATLDVTAHATKLTNYQKAIFIDTVGFISDIPTALIGSFAATLEDLALADLIIHVRDISHPDTIAQKYTVLKTLKDLNLPQKLMNTILEVGNKIDLLEKSKINDVDEHCCYISCISGSGLSKLASEIEEKLTENSGLILKIVRIPMGGEESRWLYKFAAVKNSIADPEDGCFLLAEIVFTQTSFAKFRHQFGVDFFVDNV